MRGKIVFVLVLMSAVGLIVHCGGGGGSSRPDLAGTWTGTGWADLPAVQVAASQEAEPQIMLPPCPSAEGNVRIELVMETNGTPSDLLICEKSIDFYFGTGVSGVVDQTNFKQNVIWLVFSETATQDGLFAGSVVLDNSKDYAVVYFWDVNTDQDFFLGTLQRTETVLSYSEAGMAGPWSGISVDFEELGDIFFDKNAPLDVTLSVDNSLALTGTDPDGFSLAGSLTMLDTDYGDVQGTVVAAGKYTYDVYGFPSRDGEFFGAYLESESFPNEWSIIGLRRQVILE